MKTPLAWKNLVHNKTRTAVALAGVGFAVILMFMQMGFKGAIKKTATQIYDALDFDLLLRSPAYIHLTDARTFPRVRLYQAASLPNVERARPFYLSLSEWQKPQEEATTSDDWEGDWRGIITMGTDPKDPAFTRPEICEKAGLLSDARFVLIDRKSKPEYGPADGVQFGEEDIGVQTVLGPNRVRIVGTFELGTGLAANGACLTNLAGYTQACPWQTVDQLTFGLVKLHDTSDLEQTIRQLKEVMHLPAHATDTAATAVDVEILTRDEVNAREEHHWVAGTPLGKIFNLGVWVSLFVGVAIVYQVLSTDISNMISEYATLKAMGYSNRYLTSVVLQQSVMLALVGYVPSILISWGLYELVGGKSGMPMMMTWDIALSVLLLAVLMCIFSGLAALRKLFQADPADLF